MNRPAWLLITGMVGLSPQQLAWWAQSATQPSDRSRLGRKLRSEGNGTRVVEAIQLGFREPGPKLNIDVMTAELEARVRTRSGSF